MTVNNTNGNGSAAGSLLEDPIDFTELKAWIQQQETNPRPLSPLQRRALSDLILSLRSREPETGDRDWVSLLQRYLDFHNSVGALAAYSEYSEEGTPNSRWCCQCTFKLNEDVEPLTFPNPEFGFVSVGGTPSMPSFARKKDAKKYAAKCCVEWLMACSYMPSDGENVVFATAAGSKRKAASPLKANGNGNGNGPIATTAAAAAPQPKPNQDARARNRSAAAAAAATTAAAAAAATDNDDDDNIQPTQVVSELCRRLGIAPPQYRLQRADDDASGMLFTGYADFGADSVKVPAGLGHLSERTWGQRFARERIAEQLLGWLVREERRRREDEAALLGEGEEDGQGEGEGVVVRAGSD